MKSYSQAGQDAFVCYILGEIGYGTYLEVGAGDPIEGNNTYSLEKMNWTGVSLELDSEKVEKFRSVRTNDIIMCDSTTFDWDSIKLPRVVDYLTFDVDEAALPTFERFPFDKYEFKVITIEHDAYRFGIEPRNTMRRTLANLGYQLICLDVRINGGIFEDWWVNPKYVDMARAYDVACRGIEYSSIVELMSGAHR